MGLASCVYLGTPHEDARLASRLDAVGKSVEMTSGVLVADMLEGTKFALGATMVTRRKSFQDVGGFAELGQFYADDFVLGNRLAEQGTGVLLATHVIRLVVQDSEFWVELSKPVALDAEHAAVAAVGASGDGAYVCGAVRVVGFGVGIDERASAAGAAVAAGDGGESLGAGWGRAGCDGRDGMVVQHGDVSAAGFAGQCALGS